MNYEERLQDLLDELDLFQDWTERYEYIISLGKKLPKLDEAHKTEDSLIKGCQSRVWLYTEPDKGVLKLYADSDSLITKGLIAVFIRLLSGLPPEEILKADMSKLDRTRPEGPSGAHQGERPQLHGRPDQAGRHEHGGTPLIFPV